jgi:hypothetical protein
MKCPKCGYISFDYNQVCPKCNKNISAEQEKTFLPSFRPEPPSLLGFLTGEANESNMNLRTSQGSHMGVDQQEDIGLGDSAIIESEGFGLDEQDLEMSIEAEDSGEALFEQEVEIEPEKLFSDSDFNLEQKEGGKIAAPSESTEAEELSFDLGDLSLEESGDMLDLSLEEPEKPQEQVAMDLEFDDANFSIESLDSLAEIENGGNELEPEIELNLEDLKVSDLGDLEIETEMKASEEELEGTIVEPERGSGGEEMEASALLPEEPGMDLDNLPGFSDIVTEETRSEGKEKTVILNDFSLDDAESAGVEGFEFEDIPLEASAPEEESLDLEGFDLDANDSGEMGKPLSLDDLSLDDSGELERSFDLSDISIDEYSQKEKAESATGEKLSDDDIDIDLDAMSLDVEEYQKKPAPGGDDFILDLEDMDIDLDLNEPKK